MPFDLSSLRVCDFSPFGSCKGTWRIVWLQEEESLIHGWRFLNSIPTLIEEPLYPHNPNTETMTPERFMGASGRKRKHTIAVFTVRRAGMLFDLGTLIIRIRVLVV